MAQEKTMSVVDIASGDLLCWSRNPYDKFSDLLLQMIEMFTDAKFGHVGIAWRCHDGLSDEVLVVEAALPKIHISRASEDRSFYCVPMNVHWAEDNKKFLMEKIGLKYGYLDAWNAFVGAKVDDDDNRYQCAELAHRFYLASGIQLDEKFRPKDVIESAVRHSGSSIYKVIL